jgi:hypothetical protein
MLLEGQVWDNKCGKIIGAFGQRGPHLKLTEPGLDHLVEAAGRRTAGWQLVAGRWKLAGGRWQVAGAGDTIRRIQRRAAAS